MTKKAKIKYGLKNVYYSLINEDAEGAITYGTPKPFPGARSLSLEPQGEMTKWHADNTVYFVADSNQGYEGDLTMARIIDDFHTDVLGNIKDDKGVIAEYADILGKKFALLFQFETDIRSVRHVLYNCTASRPTVGSSTKEDTIEPQEETVTITAVPRVSDNLVKCKTSEDANEIDNTVYNSWFTQVYVPVRSESDTVVINPGETGSGQTGSGN